MVGRPEDGPGIEGAPLALLERVTAFLAQERAKLRTELKSANAGATASYLAYAASFSSLHCKAMTEVQGACTFLSRVLGCMQSRSCRGRTASSGQATEGSSRRQRGQHERC